MGVKALYIVVLLAATLSLEKAAYAQSESDFRTEQFSSERVVKAWETYNNQLRLLFTSKNLQWPPNDIFIRAFKLHNELEIWARDAPAKPYKHVKTYRICAMSGGLGPKRKKGDKQVPEGYYFIEDFNPRSDYHLSLGINYPNYTDVIQAKSDHPGGDIYIHGGCLTVGCMPMENEGIGEIYTLCLNARLNGQNYIPVHVYPLRLTEKGMAMLQKETAGNKKMPFWNTLKEGYDYFEQNHKLLPVMYTTTGNYIN
jgi:murein L,D-transpeptidase YafK